MFRNVEISEGMITLRISREMYPKEVLIQTCYVKLDEAWYLLDEDEKHYIIELRPKKPKSEEEMKILAYAFLDELIESQAYIDQLKRTKEIRQTILERALLTQEKKDK